jgi:hypothetical protein
MLYGYINYFEHMKTKSALIPGYTAYDVTPVTINTPPVPPAVSPTIAPVPINQRLTRTTDDGPPVPPPTPQEPFDMNDTNALLTPCLLSEFDNLETFIIPSQVIRVTLHYLHKVMISVKMRCFLILITNLVQILKASVIMLSFLMLIYLNMTVIPSLLLKLC